MKPTSTLEAVVRGAAGVLGGVLGYLVGRWFVSQHVLNESINVVYLTLVGLLLGYLLSGPLVGLSERAVRWSRALPPDAVLAAYFGRLGATVETTAEPRAYYHPVRDLIHLPPIGTFHTAQGYYETLGHEAVHWTGHGSRLDRLARCRDREGYAFEELVAEVGQCLLFARLGLTPSIDQSAAYEMLCFMAPDVVEGYTALMEKREPAFPSAR